MAKSKQTPKLVTMTGRILAALTHGGDMTCGDLTAAVKLRETAVYGAAREAVRAGLARIGAPRAMMGGSVQTYRITPAGRRALEAARRDLAAQEEASDAE